MEREKLTVWDLEEINFGPFNIDLSRRIVIKTVIHFMLSSAKG